MDDDQQFCLRWNNHQSTLISVFDTLLENGTLVDCTLAAEGKFLKAHKVVLSACSPYFATLLSQQYDKHPIFILKDVKFQELRAMMDYMYRGEVNISQDQLAALLKAAESLQIKGLSDSRSGGSVGSGGTGQKQSTNEHKQLAVPATTATKGVSPSGYTIEQKRPRHTVGGPSSIDSLELSGSREGSSSPTTRKRKKIRRRSIDNINADNHEHSNSSSQSMKINSSLPLSNTSATAISSVSTSAAQQSTSTTAASVSAAGGNGSMISGGLNVTKKTDSVSLNTKLETGMEHDMDNDDNDDDEHDENEKPITVRKEQNHNKRKQHAESDNGTGKDSTGGEMLIEPKSEYDDGNDETVEDLTLDDEELLEDLEQAGPSHGGGEGSSQGYAQWQVDRSQDDVFMAAQEAAGQQRDPQDYTAAVRTSSFLRDYWYELKFSDLFKLINPDGRYQCPRFNCGKSYKDASSLQRHIRYECGGQKKFRCIMCGKAFSQSSHLKRHLESVKLDKSEQTDITPEEFELDDCILESNDIVITQNKDGFVLHVKKLGNITTTAKLPTTEEHQQQQQVQQAQQVQQHIQQHQQIEDIKPQIASITSCHQLKLPSAECELIQLKKVSPSTSTVIGTTIIQPVGDAQAINSLLGLREVNIQQKNIGPRIKYSRGKFSPIPHQSNSNSGLQMSDRHGSPEEKKYEIQEIDLNTQAQASIISDLVKYAEIDDIELPDGTKIGIGFAPAEITEHIQSTQVTQVTEHSESPSQSPGQCHETTVTKSYTLLTTSPMKPQQQQSQQQTTTYELSLSDSSMTQSDDNDKLYVCRHCGKKYRWKSTLRRHENVECGGKEPCHPCPYCTYKAKQRGNLGVHVRKHHPDKPQLESKRGRRTM